MTGKIWLNFGIQFETIFFMGLKIRTMKETSYWSKTGIKLLHP